MSRRHGGHRHGHHHHGLTALLLLLHLHHLKLHHLHLLLPKGLLLLRGGGGKGWTIGHHAGHASGQQMRLEGVVDVLVARMRGHLKAQFGVGTAKELVVVGTSLGAARDADKSETMDTFQKTLASVRTG